MVSIPLSLAIESGRQKLFDHIERGGQMWNGEGPRWVSAPVLFAMPFAAAPTVQLSIAMIDADSGRNLRLELHAENITPEGFTAVAHTWGDTCLGRLQVHWFAIGTRIDESAPEWDV